MLKRPLLMFESVGLLSTPVSALAGPYAHCVPEFELRLQAIDFIMTFHETGRPGRRAMEVVRHFSSRMCETAHLIGENGGFS
jgi:hypothetical protein